MRRGAFAAVLLLVMVGNQAGATMQCGLKMTSRLTLHDLSGDKIWARDLNWTWERPLASDGKRLFVVPDVRNEVFRVASFRRSDGALLWQTRFRDEHIADGPKVVGGTVLVLGFEKLFGFDADSGRILFTHRIADVGPSLHTADGLVFITDRYRTYAVSARSGRIEWSRPFGSHHAVLGGRRLWALVGSHDIVALDPETGKTEWRWRRGRSQHFYGEVYGAHEGRVIVSEIPKNGPERDEEFVAIDLEKKSIAWDRFIQNEYSLAELIDGVLYDVGDQVLARGARGGRKLWIVPPQITRGDRTMYVIGSRRKFTFLGTRPRPLVRAVRTRTGRAVWTRKLSAAYGGGTAFSGGLLYVGLSGTKGSSGVERKGQGGLTALEIETGRERFVISLREPVRVDPRVGVETIGILGSDPEIFCDSFG